MAVIALLGSPFRAIALENFGTTGQRGGGVIINTMLTQIRKIYFAAGVSLLVATPAQADSAADAALAARRSIEAVYKATDLAQSRMDSKTLFSRWAPGYQMIDIKGQKLNRSEVSRNVELWFSTSKWLKVKTTIKKFSLHKNQAAVVIAERADAAGVNPHTRKLMKLISNSTAEETWVHIKGRWLKQRTKTLTLKLIVDGKPYKP